MRLARLSKGGLNGVISVDSTSRIFSPSMLTMDCPLTSSCPLHLLHASQRTSTALRAPWAVKSPLDYLPLPLLTVLLCYPAGLGEEGHTEKDTVCPARV